MRSAAESTLTVNICIVRIQAKVGEDSEELLLSDLPCRLACRLLSRFSPADLEVLPGLDSLTALAGRTRICDRVDDCQAAGACFQPTCKLEAVIYEFSRTLSKP